MSLRLRYFSPLVFVLATFVASVTANGKKIDGVTYRRIAREKLVGRSTTPFS